MFGKNEKVVIGYDLSDEYAQISYCRLSDDMPETLSLVEGVEQYNIPTCLFKRSEVNQWFFGKEALAYSKVEEGIILNHLYEQSLIGEEILVVEENFDPVALLALYIKRSFSLLAGYCHLDRINGIMFTVPNLTKRSIEVLNQIAVLLDMKETVLAFQGRDESIYYYIIHQPDELWKYDVEIYDFSLEHLKSYYFHKNIHAAPIVVFVDETEHESISKGTTDGQDLLFLDVIKETTKEKIISSAYLIGEGFNGEWCNESLRTLCRNRRAFRGNNLYSKGACYAMKARLEDENSRKNMIFLGKDKLKANIGMEVLRKGEKSYLALLNGGENWYDSKKECDLILCLGNSFSIIITPLDGRNIKTVEVVLYGLPMREEKTTRIRMNLFMEQEDNLRVTVTDLGFGEIYPSSNQTFTQQISLS